MMHLAQVRPGISRAGKGSGSHGPPSGNPQITACKRLEFRTALFVPVTPLIPAGCDDQRSCLRTTENCTLRSGPFSPCLSNSLFIQTLTCAYIFQSCKSAYMNCRVVLGS